MLMIPIHHRFEFQTGMSKDMVVRTLQLNVQVDRPLKIKLPARRFVGNVYETGFRVREQVSITWGTLPLFRGDITEVHDGTCIRVEVTDLFATFMGLIFWFWCLAGLGLGLWYAVAGVRDASLMAFAAGLLGGCLAGLHVMAYWRKVADGRSLLQDLFPSHQ